MNTITRIAVGVVVMIIVVSATGVVVINTVGRYQRRWDT